MKHFMLMALLCTAPAFAEGPLVLTTTGLGDVRVGMDVDDLGRALREALPYTVSESCVVITSKPTEGYGISYMLEDRHVTRINVDFYANDPRPRTIKTAAGVGLGSLEADVLKAYAGKTRIKPNPGDPTWHTIFVDDPDQQRGIVFETNGQDVKSMRAGQYPSIEYSAGCN